MAALGGHFDALAPRYDGLRPDDANWWEVLEALVAEGDLAPGRRVLDVGCGTGRLAHALAARGARVWGVDPSEEMHTVARAAGALAGGGFKRARAESLPFRRGWFDRVVFRQSVHLVERPSAFPEAVRVLGSGGRIAVATFHPDHFDRVWIARLFPRVGEIDRERFPTPQELQAELAAAGFGEPRVRQLAQEAPVLREDALDRIRGRYISTLHLLEEDELREGLARAELELPAVIPSSLDWLIVTAHLA